MSTVLAASAIMIVFGAIAGLAGLGLAKMAGWTSEQPISGRPMELMIRFSLGGFAVAVGGLVIAFVGVMIDGITSETASPEPQAASITEPGNGRAGVQSETTAVFEDSDDIFVVMEVAFIGSPSRNEIAPLIRRAFTATDTTYSDTNIRGLADVLVALRKSSNVGITELEVLRCMAASGPIPSVAFDEHAALVSSILELSDGICL